MCQICQKEFESKRADAKFCSSKCRKASSRGVTDNYVTDNSTDNVTDKLVKINIVPKDEWRRDYLEEHAEFFIKRLKETKECPKCKSIREQFKSEFMFCPKDLQFPKLALNI